MTKNEGRLSKLFKELVPDMGKAESLAENWSEPSTESDTDSATTATW